MTRARPGSHPRAGGDRRLQGVQSAVRSADTGYRNPDPMLTISIIFALLVLLWGRIGVAHPGS